MRIRGTKPEFWKSKRIASVSWEDRLLLKGLESYVDDNGVGVDDVELIVTDVFPRDMFANPRETVARVSEGITRLTEAGLLHRYTSESDDLLYVAFWEDIQRIDKPGKGRYPRPDGTWNYKDSMIRESVASPRETVAPVTGEQGNRGTETHRASATDTPRSSSSSGRSTRNGQTSEQHSRREKRLSGERPRRRSSPGPRHTGTIRTEPPPTQRTALLGSMPIHGGTTRSRRGIRIVRSRSMSNGNSAITK